MSACREKALAQEASNTLLAAGGGVAGGVVAEFNCSRSRWYHQTYDAVGGLPRSGRLCP